MSIRTWRPDDAQSQRPAARPSAGATIARPGAKPAPPKPKPPAAPKTPPQQEPAPAAPAKPAATTPGPRQSEDLLLPGWCGRRVEVTIRGRETPLIGVLVARRRYTIALREDGREAMTAVPKHAIDWTRLAD